MPRAAPLYRLIVGFLIVVIAALLFERGLAAEYIQMLELKSNFEIAYKELKIGMTQEDVRLRILVPPDSVNQTDDGVTFGWNEWDHIGVLHKLFGIELLDPKSYMQLGVDFDKNGHVIRIYYQG